MMRRIVMAVGALALATPLFAAEAGISIGENLYYVSTGTEGGECKTRDVGKGPRETVCMDGDNVAGLSSEEGCLDSNGKAWCALEQRQLAGQAGSELTCAKGKNYFLLVGPKATCKIDNGRKTCASPDTKSTASADCKSGCIETAGAGSCCEAGKPGCPPRS